MLLLTIAIAGAAVGTAMASVGQWMYKRGVADGLEQAGRAAERATIASLQQELSRARAELQEMQRKITRG